MRVNCRIYNILVIRRSLMLMFIQIFIVYSVVTVMPTFSTLKWSRSVGLFARAFWHFVIFNFDLLILNNILYNIATGITTDTYR